MTETADGSQHETQAPAHAATQVSVVIPAYNEEAAIGGVVEQIDSVLSGSGIEYEIIVIDDGSTDRTAERIDESRATVITHEANRGYGAALKTGIRSAKYDWVCIFDADGTYPAERFRDLIAECENADMVVGARTRSDVHIPWLRRPPKWFLNRLANYMTATKIPDLNSGMRIIRRDLVLEYIDLLPDRFSFTTTITLAALCDGYRVKFLPIEYKRRIGRSKIRPIDALNFLVLILRTTTYFRPLRIFLPVSLLLFAVAAVKLGFDIIKYDNIEDTSVMLSLAALQILFLGMLADLIAFLRRRMKKGDR